MRRVGGSPRPAPSADTPLHDDPTSSQTTADAAPRADARPSATAAASAAGSAAPDALASLSLQHRRILDAVGEGIYEIDREGRTRFVNAAAARLLGWTPDELLDRPVHEVLYGPDQVDDGLSPIHSALADGDEYYVKDDQFRRKDGDSIPVEFICRPIVEQEAVVGAVITFQDIAERRDTAIALTRARDAALESARSKSEFLANMSHEIRTPLNGIVGMSALLLDTGLPPEQQRSAEIIKFSADALLNIVNDILDYSKIESGKMVLESLEFDLGHVVEHTIESFAERAQAKGVDLAAVIDRAVPSALRGDPGRLRQILSNLVSNALKFTARGEVAVHVSCESDGDADGAAEGHVQLRFDVTDTGIGIAPEHQARLFDVFTQADSSTTRVYGGTGLGLAIVKSLAEQMGGSTGVQSALGQGSRFWFTARFAVPRLVPADTLPLAGARALVVDDNETSRLALRQHLEAAGAAAHSVARAEDALRAVRQMAAAATPYDVVLIDQALSDMSGMALAEMVMATRPHGPRIILLTPLLADSETVRQANARGYYRLAQPVRRSQLIGTMVAALAGAPMPAGTAPLGLPSGARRMAAGASSGTPASAPAPTPAQANPASPNVGPNATYGDTAAAPPRPLARVLVVEDNRVNQQVATQQLARLGYAADAVGNGFEALEALTRIPYDLVFMDVQMPELDGYATTRELRRREGDGRRTIVIAMTAHALPGDRQVCLDAGMDDYVPKPVRMERLADVLRKHLGARPAESPSPAAASDTGAPYAGIMDDTTWRTLREIHSSSEAGFLHDILQLYVENATLSLDSLHASLAKGDMPAVVRLAHGLRGSSGSLGLNTMTLLCGRLEESGREAALADARAVVRRLDQELQRVRAAVAPPAAAGDGHLARRSTRSS